MDASDSPQLHAVLAAAAATVILANFNKQWSSRVFDAVERVVVEGLPAVGSLQFRCSPDDYARTTGLTPGEFDEFRELLQQQVQLLVLPPIGPQAYGDDFDRARYVYAPQTALGWISLLADRRNVDFPGDAWLGPTRYSIAWNDIRSSDREPLLIVADLLSHVSPVADQLVLKATQDRLCESRMRVFATFVGSASPHAARALDLLLEGLRQENFEVAYVITEASLNMPRAWPASPEDLSESDPVALAEAAIVVVDHEIAETLEQIPVAQRIAARKKRDGLPLLIVRVDPVKSQFSVSTSFGVDGWEPAGSWLPPNFVDSAESASARTQALMTAMEPVLAWLRRLRSEPLSESTPSWPTR